MAIEYVDFGNSDGGGSFPGGFTIFVVLILFINLVFGSFIAYQYSQNPALFSFTNDVDNNPLPSPTTIPSFPVSDVLIPININTIEGYYEIETYGSITFQDGDDIYGINLFIDDTTAYFKDGEILGATNNTKDISDIKFFVDDGIFYFIDQNLNEYLTAPVTSENRLFSEFLNVLNNNLLSIVYDEIESDNFNQIDNNTLEMTIQYSTPDDNSLDIPLKVGIEDGLVSSITYDDGTEIENTFRFEYTPSTEVDFDSFLSVPDDYTENPNLFG